METGTLKKKIAELPENLKVKVEAFVDALADLETNQNKPKTDFMIKKGFGGGKGLIAYMDEDFDAPLEDFKDYM